jgi:hypothetical protein
MLYRNHHADCIQERRISKATKKLQNLADICVNLLCEQKAKQSRDGFPFDSQSAWPSLAAYAILAKSMLLEKHIIIDAQAVAD